MLRRVFLLALVAGVVGCSLVLGVDGYRDCDGGECTGSTLDATTDVAADVPPGPPCVEGEPDAGACPSATPACHAGKCVGVRKLAQGASNHVCALMTDDSIYCWGMNNAHQAGPTGTFVKVPTLVNLPKAYGRVLDIAVEVNQTCVLAEDGTRHDVLCWGDSQVGGGSASPTKLNVADNVLSMSIGSVSACAQLANGTLSCWGQDDYGEIGCTGPSGACADAGRTPATILSPVTLAPKSIGTPKAFAVGLYQTCMVDTANKLECFGNPFRGNLGDGVASAPTDTCCGHSNLDFQIAVSAVKASDFYACAKDSNGAFRCWGDGTNTGCAPTGGSGCSGAVNPTVLNLGVGVLDDVFLGWRHACALAKGKLYCWGSNDYHVVSANDPGGAVVKSTQVTFAGDPSETIVDVAPHRKLACALTSKGRVLCWGQNEDAWLTGVGSVAPEVSTPTEVRWR